MDLVSRTINRLIRLRRDVAYKSAVHGRKSEAAIQLSSLREPILLDTGMNSGNSGDDIIMHYAMHQMQNLIELDQATHIPTHGRNEWTDTSIRYCPKIVCGTNAISTKPNSYNPIALPANPELYRQSILLLAAGLRDVDNGERLEGYSAELLHYLLIDDVKYLHSVRDSNTEKALKGIGINNVINTSCVTMWDLTPDFCKKINRVKQQDVLTTITDYCFNPELDKYMIDMLKRHYRNVYIWIQGAEDEKKLSTILDIHSVKLIEGRLPALDQFIKSHHNIDYFGTRLHCGVFCLNHGIRTMIVGVDNRAKDIKLDTNLPVVQRTELPDKMERLISDERETVLHIPFDNINKWKSQFVQKDAFAK